VETNDVLTTGQIAKICRVDGRTVKRWINEGILKAYELPITGISRVRIDDFLLFLKRNKMPIPDDMKYLAKHRLLVVDDEKHMLSAIRRILTYPDSDQFVIKEAGDGFEAGQILSEFKPDLVILDILMPKMDGLNVLKQIKSNPETRHIKVIVLSGLMVNEERQKVINLGASDLLAKPFDEQEFRRRVYKLLGKDLRDE